MNFVEKWSLALMLGIILIVSASAIINETAKIIIYVLFLLAEMLFIFANEKDGDK